MKAVGPCRIAFRVRVADYGDAPSDLYVVNQDGTGLHKLTRTPGLQEWIPVWSPDGRKIAFSATRTYGEATQVFVINADGTGLRQLTHPDPAGHYSDLRAWSPDAKSITYAKTDLARGGWWRINANGTGEPKRVRAADSSWPSPDGKWIVELRNSGVDSDYYGSPDMYARRSNGDDGHWLTHTGDAESYGWSPDGEWVLYRRMSGPTGLYVVHVDGSGRKRLSTDAEDYDATWSPDAKLILYTSQSRPEGLRTVSPSGGAPRRLTHRVNDLSPSWSPTGRRIIFKRGFGEILVMNRDGSALTEVARPHGTAIYEAPAWSPACR